MKKNYFFFFPIFILFLFNCNQKEKPVTESSKNNSIEKTDDKKIPARKSLDNETNNNFHTDGKYKYEHRTGNSKEYEYNYDVEGYDQDGNYVNGNVDITGKNGSGSIEDENGNEIDVEVEWVDYGKLEATDDEGNTYDLEADE